jgi:hypothetical protein
MKVDGDGDCAHQFIEADGDSSHKAKKVRPSGPWQPPAGLWLRGWSSAVWVAGGRPASWRARMPAAPWLPQAKKQHRKVAGSAQVASVQGGNIVLGRVEKASRAGSSRGANGARSAPS